VHFSPPQANLGILAMSWLKELKRGIERFGEVEKPRAERRSASGLEAQYGVEIPGFPAGIKDISASGVYLLTEKRLGSGELITLVLREKGQSEPSADLQFSVHARVARQGEDGIGLSFDLPPGMDLDLWNVLLRNIVVLTDPEQVADMFHTLRTILFLCRICQSYAEQPILLLGKDLPPERMTTLVKIVQTADERLASEPDSDRFRAHPGVVTSILRDGSWATDDQTINLWVGLLVASCSLDVPDDSNQLFADLLVQLTPTQTKVFILACERALGIGPGAGNRIYGSIVISPKEMVELTGVHDLTRAATDMGYLYNLGLIKNVFNFSSYHDIESFDIAPSDLGIELYRHCHGSREKVEPQLIESARSHLANFLPAPQSMALDPENTPLPTYTPD
jgi:PilZ domain